MKRIFLGLAMWAFIFMFSTVGLGFSLRAGDPGLRQWHLLAGLFTALFLVLLHCTIFVHLLGTGLGVKKAIFEHGMEEAEPTAKLRQYKMRAYPIAFFCMVVAIATAVMGGATLTGAAPTSFHRWLAIGLIVSNIITVPLEVMVLGENADLINAIDAEVARRVASADAAPSPDAKSPDAKSPVAPAHDSVEKSQA